MKKLSILTLTMIALSSFMATTVLAQNVHLKPPNSEPRSLTLLRCNSRPLQALPAWATATYSYN
jgi:hypothetical protein